MVEPVVDFLKLELFDHFLFPMSLQQGEKISHALLRFTY